MKKISYLIAVLMLLSILGACQPTPVNPDGEDIDPTKTQIYVGIYEGGFGVDWIKTAAKEYNSLPENSEYQVIIAPNVLSTDDIKVNIESGVGVQDAYFITEPNIQNLINLDLLENLDDIYKTKIPGEETTIQGKLRNREVVETALSLKGEGLYGLPYGDGFVGLIFDYDLFAEKNWLLRDSEDASKLSKGPDNELGTYDDGQPTNIQEWEYMLSLIYNEANAHPFVFTTQFPNYLTSIVDAIAAQYAGLDEYRTFMTFNGKITDSSGSIIDVTPETGYKVYEMAGLEKAVEFLDKYFTNHKNYVNGISWETTSTSHRDAQDRFVTGYIQSSQTTLGAMLVDGNWWENETKPMFTSLANRGQSERGYGKRDYRYMMFPKLEGQKGIDGNGHGSVLNCMDAGVVFVPKTERSAEKLAKIKDFLAFTCKDEYLQEFTIKSGGVRPYNYTLSKEQFDSLTPFAQNVWQIYNDTDNVSFVRGNLDANLSAFHYATAKPVRYHTKLSGASYPYIFSSLVRHTAAEALSSMKKDFRENWGTYYSEYLDY